MYIKSFSTFLNESRNSQQDFRSLIVEACTHFDDKNPGVVKKLAQLSIDQFNEMMDDAESGMAKKYYYASMCLIEPHEYLRKEYDHPREYTDREEIEKLMDDGDDKKMSEVVISALTELENGNKEYWMKINEFINYFGY